MASYPRSYSQRIPRPHFTPELCVTICKQDGETRNEMGFESVCIHRGHGGRFCLPVQLGPKVPEPSTQFVKCTDSHWDWHYPGWDPPPILLELMVDNDAGSVTMRVHRVFYVQPPFVSILLSGKLNPAKTWKRLWGALVIANLEDGCRAVINCLWFTLICSAPNVLSSLLKYDPTAPLYGAVLLKQSHGL